MNKNISIAIHGGAGTIDPGLMSPEMEKQYVGGLEEALSLGYAALAQGKSALDAVEMATCCLENNPLFNAGKGSVFNALGKHEMDASIMDGSNLEAGAVALIKNIKNPISFARKIMEQTEHVFLAGEGAMELANEWKIKMEEDAYFYTEQRYHQWQQSKQTGEIVLDHSYQKKFGTVGAVALDQNGNLAAATSTGGMTNKKFGRVGDTPMIGAGTYADNATCAVSCTGSGEFFIRANAAFHVHALMKYAKLNVRSAADFVIHNVLTDIQGDGGLIAVDHEGNVHMPFNTSGMYRAFMNNKGDKKCLIYK